MISSPPQVLSAHSESRDRRGGTTSFRSRMKRGIVAAPLVGLPLGLALRLYGAEAAANLAWMIATLPVLAKLAFDIIVVQLLSLGINGGRVC